MRGFLVVLAVIGLTGCEASYHDYATLGLVRSARLTADTAQISANGPATTSPDVVERFVLRRAAEETIADGFDLFQIVTTEDSSRGGAQSIGFAQGTRGGAIGFGSSFSTVRPGRILVIHMINGPRPETMPTGLYDAREVLKYACETPAPNAAPGRCSR